MPRGLALVAAPPLNSAASPRTRIYDAFGNLKRVDLPGGNVIEYLVDGQNRRVAKKKNGALLRQWLYRDAIHPVAELDGSGNMVSTFVYVTGRNSPDYVVRGTQTLRILSDQLGSPRMVVDATTGVLSQRMRHDVFGTVTEDTNPGFTPFGFAGGIYDADTGLVRFGARDYDPETGKWTSKDPIRFHGGQNLYGYLSANPVNGTDPSGEAPTPVCPLVLAFCAGFSATTEVLKVIDAYLTCVSKARAAERAVSACGSDQSRRANEAKVDAMWECVGNAAGFNPADVLVGACAVAVARVCAF
jgi:RHS repeat-associated protein